MSHTPNTKMISRVFFGTRVLCSFESYAALRCRQLWYYYYGKTNYTLSTMFAAGMAASLTFVIMLVICFVAWGLVGLLVSPLRSAPFALALGLVAYACYSIFTSFSALRVRITCQLSYQHLKVRAAGLSQSLAFPHRSPPCRVK